MCIRMHLRNCTAENKTAFYQNECFLKLWDMSEVILFLCYSCKKRTNKMQAVLQSKSKLSDILMELVIRFLNINLRKERSTDKTQSYAKLPSMES